MGAKGTPRYHAQLVVSADGQTMSHLNRTLSGTSLFSGGKKLPTADGLQALSPPKRKGKARPGNPDTIKKYVELKKQTANIMEHNYATAREKTCPDGYVI